MKWLGLANAFSGGIFLGIALFHLLPESCERFEAAITEGLWAKLPNAYFLAFMSYSLILFVEKVAFDSHSLIQHDHGDGHGHGHDNHNHDSKLELESKDNHSHGHKGHKHDEKKEKCTYLICKFSD